MVASLHFEIPANRRCLCLLNNFSRESEAVFKMNRGFALSVATVFVLCLCSLVEASEQKSGKINFEPLPEGEGYRLDEWTASWGLSGLVDVSSGVALLIKPNPPYGQCFRCFRSRCVSCISQISTIISARLLATFV